ncbi:hypothetical protein [Algoriphagus sp.]|uniref:hypothetical protein n=1 Tax=Algoriphagus sp. TaxID=1872435 RepID=UPI0039198EAF
MEELIVGEFTFHLDSLTKSVYEIKVVKDGNHELLLTKKSALKYKGWAFVFTDPVSGFEVNRIEIPYQGPESMKAGISGNVVISKYSVFVVNLMGEIAEYNQNGQQIRFFCNLKNYLDSNEINKTRLSLNRKFEFIEDAILQFNVKPNTNNLPESNGQKYEFSINFTEWILSINLNTLQIEKSDFGMPQGYERFKNDFTATNLVGSYDLKRNKYYLGWPSSNEIYVLEGVDLIERITPGSNVEFNFIPREIELLPSGWTNWALPKEGAENLFLLYVEKNDLILKCSKIKESGAGKTKFERTKHYVLSVYSGDWDPLGEYFFDYEFELDLENWFLTSEGLFINKPEQKSEDEYEFYKIDLSRFKN